MTLETERSDVKTSKNGSKKKQGPLETPAGAEAKASKKSRREADKQTNYREDYRKLKAQLKVKQSEFAELRKRFAEEKKNAKEETKRFKSETKNAKINHSKAINSLQVEKKAYHNEVVALKTQLKSQKAQATADYNTLLAEKNSIHGELKEIQSLVKSDVVEQLKIKTRALKIKNDIVTDLEGRIANTLNFMDDVPDASNPEASVRHLVASMLVQGYHEQGRLVYLDLVKEDDWKNLLTFFKSTNNGFDALEKLRPLFEPWIHHYHGMIDVILDQGFSIRPLEDYADHGIRNEKTLYMYHDVHAWDLIPALGMALANKDRGICSTFCLNIDQAEVDLSHDAGYRVFGTLVSDNVQVGLHCNPFASWIRMDVFEENEEKFIEWFKSDAAKDDLSGLLSGKTKSQSGPFAKITRKDAEAGTFKRLEKNFAKLRSFHPTARAANHHGDIVNKMFGGLSMLQKKTNPFITVHKVLTDSRSHEFGIGASPSLLRKEHSLEIFNETQNRSQYYENLHEKLNDKQPRLLINHPGAISNNSLTMNLDFVRTLSSSCFEQYLPANNKL